MYTWSYATPRDPKRCLTPRTHAHAHAHNPWAECPHDGPDALFSSALVILMVCVWPHCRLIVLPAAALAAVLFVDYVRRYSTGWLLSFTKSW